MAGITNVRANAMVTNTGRMLRMTNLLLSSNEMNLTVAMQLLRQSADAIIVNKFSFTALEIVRITYIFSFHYADFRATSSVYLSLHL
jgi:hypothetical protein